MQNFFLKLLSYITYKKKENEKEFYIPEVNELDGSNISFANNKGDKSKTVKPKPVEKKKPDDDKVATDIDSNLKFIEDAFNYPVNKEIIIREFRIADDTRAFLVFIDGMADRATINNFILRPLLTVKAEYKNKNKMEYVYEKIIQTNQIERQNKYSDVISSVLMGDTVLYIDGCNFYITSETKGYDKRSVEKPLIEGVVKGAQEAFNENLKTNTALIRRIVKNSKLTTEYIKIGERNNNLCAVMYIDGLINPAIVDEIKRRIKSLKTDYVAGTGMLEQFIEDSPMSLVPTVVSTERPDSAASHLVEGKAVIIADGTPFALVVPISIATLFHSPEDTSLRWQYGTFVRIIRLFAIFIATLLPGLYVAITDFHHEMIPTDLMIAIAKARENVPFPTIVEILLMEISFELIREAGLRIPGIIGNTIGIIGALILGQAAIQAGLVSPVLIIVVAVTGLGNFAIPDFSMAFAARVLRFIFIFAGAFLGFYGIALALVGLTSVLVNIKSFGVPITSMISPIMSTSKDILIEWPVWMHRRRPDSVNPLDVKRQADNPRGWTRQEPHYKYDRNGNDRK